MSALPAPTPAVVGGASIQTVNARDLHAALGVGKDFSSWLKDRIRQYDFAESVDFVLLPNSGEYSGRGQPAKEYAISLDMAKELCMVERNEAGKAARRYYIECERRAQQQPNATAALNDPAALRSMLLAYTEKVGELQPKADALDRIATAKGSLCITDTAKHLQITRKRLIAGLRKNRWIYRRTRKEPWLGYHDKEDSPLYHRLEPSLRE